MADVGKGHQILLKLVFTSLLLLIVSIGVICMVQHSVLRGIEENSWKRQPGAKRERLEKKSGRNGKKWGGQAE